MPSKLNLKVKGPYVFVHYMGPLQVTARITSLDGMGETRMVSAANLLPIHPKLPASITAAKSDKDDWAKDVLDDDSSRGKAAADIGDQQGRGPPWKRAHGAT